MMTNITFDTLRYSQRIKAAGFTDEQANEQAKAIAEIIYENLAAKQELKELELRLTQKLELLKKDIK